MKINQKVKTSYKREITKNIREGFVKLNESFRGIFPPKKAKKKLIYVQNALKHVKKKRHADHTFSP